MAKAVHMMIRVLDEARSVAFYEQAFGLAVADRVDFETFTLVYMSHSSAPFELELTVNKGRTEPYEVGNGYGHLAFVVDDLPAEHQRLSAAGFNPRDIKQLGVDGSVVGTFFFVSDPDGYQIEVLAKAGRFR
jgi:lactoylglutathione lyase